ncbi:MULTISPECIES: hypothetical protein [Asticcacaulis]|uniref:hypothetical protein n=1 Tax=Asticcacaulis TaxID=76890 RepID=UPI001FD9033C|nr:MULTISPECIES: hypothetical protein [Asticcacaulis]MBP2159706.1 hypothetical protein [Asticcacaulis solisilvae]MDR6800467.1 hypothetical protein [Asticcacaulis sp. BE141]
MATTAGLAEAAQLSPDLRTQRNAQPVLRDGDFDGDGRTDSLRLVNEADSGRIAVHVRLADGRDQRVTSFDAAIAPALRVVPAGAYAVDCGNFATACADAPIRMNADGLIMAMDGGISVLLHWQDGQFAQDFIRSDEADMARVASALYAVNR